MSRPETVLVWQSLENYDFCCHFVLTELISLRWNVSHMQRTNTSLNASYICQSAI